MDQVGVVAAELIAARLERVGQEVFLLVEVAAEEPEVLRLETGAMALLVKLT